MNTINFLATNWDYVLLAIVATFLYRQGEITMLGDLLFMLVIKAEKDFGGGTGELKKADVMTRVYERLPKIVTLILTRTKIERLMEAALDRAKKKWVQTPNLHEYVYGLADEAGK